MPHKTGFTVFRTAPLSVFCTVAKGERFEFAVEDAVQVLSAPKTPTSSRSAPGDHEFNASIPQSTRLVPGRDRCRATIVVDRRSNRHVRGLSGTERAVRELVQLWVEQLVACNSETGSITGGA